MLGLANISDIWDPMLTGPKPQHIYFGLISVGYHLELRVAITFDRLFFYQLSYIILFGVSYSSTYVLWVKNDVLGRML
jgi:hypothetical protein